MALKVDYYTSLLRAVGDLDRDAYAARGAIYEREHKPLMRLLYSADPPRAEIEIEREQLAFRDAMRRVEFGDDEQQVPLAPLRGPPPEVPIRAVSVAADPTSATPIAATPPTVPFVSPRRAAIPAPAIPTSPRPQPVMRAAVTSAPAPD